MLVDCGRKLEHVEETHRGMERTSQLQVVLTEGVSSFLHAAWNKQQDDGVVYIRWILQYLFVKC